MYLPIIAKMQLLTEWLHGNRAALIVNAWEHIMLPWFDDFLKSHHLAGKVAIQHEDVGSLAL